MTGPADPDARDERPRLFTGLYWAMMALAAVCTAAALMVAVLGPRLFVAAPKAARSPAASGAAAPAPRAAALGARGDGR